MYDSSEENDRVCIVFISIQRFFIHENVFMEKNISEILDMSGSSTMSSIIYYYIRRWVSPIGFFYRTSFIQ